MNNNSWFRTSKDIELVDGSKIRIYRTVFETSDYATSEESVKWCMSIMDREEKHEPDN